ncbi:Alpha/beta hydrolase fold-1 [Mycena polygramma]|nr:Alpha/beta hydrolase fold-1 [Mycena polygramma]
MEIRLECSPPSTHTTMSQPTIVIIPGSFCVVSFYDAVIAGLRAAGYPVHGVELETVGRRDKAPTMYDDATAVASVVSRLADEGKDVVLVPHSYGGLVACEASKGLAKSVREREGKSGGIVRIVFTTAVVGAEGQSLNDVFGDGAAGLDFLRVEGDYMAMEPVGSAAVNFSDLPAEEGIAWASKMPNHATASFTDKLTYAAYKDIPVSYLFCEEDRCIPPKLQNEIIARMEAEMAGRKVDRHSLKTSHCPMASQPGKLVAVIREAIKDTV